jgi:predicted Holliday junction resolvase-like endonuclease
VRWHNIEKTAPLLPWFQYKIRDMTFVGKGIDYIIFDGLSSGNLKEIVFLEIKSGSSTQNNNEKMIEEIIKRGKVRYEVMRR